MKLSFGIFNSTKGTPTSHRLSRTEPDKALAKEIRMVRVAIWQPYYTPKKESRNATFECLAELNLVKLWRRDSYGQCCNYGNPTPPKVQSVRNKNNSKHKFPLLWFLHDWPPNVESCPFHDLTGRN